MEKFFSLKWDKNFLNYVKQSSYGWMLFPTSPMTLTWCLLTPHSHFTVSSAVM